MAEEPVEIDINLRQNVSEEADKAARSFDKMAEASDEVWKRSDEAFKLQKEVVSKLKSELKSLEEAFDKVNFSTHDAAVIEERQKLSKSVRELRAELNGEEEALKNLEKANNSYSEKQHSLLTQMREVKNEMAQLKIDGKSETDMYREKEEQLRTLATAHRELTQEQKLLSSGSASLQGFLSGLSGLTGLLSAGGGALGLFNQNSEEFAKIQTKVQSLMAITIGLQQIQNTLHQTSAFRIQTVTKAKLMWATATNRLTVALGGSAVAAKVLMASLTLGLSVAIGAVISMLDKYISKQRQAREEQNKLNEAVSSAAASQIANYEKLRSAYNKLGDDVKAKEKFILDNQGAFTQLGVSINDVNAADNLFISQTDAFRSAIEQRARAAASMELATEKYREALQKQAKIDSIRDVAPSSYSIGGGMMAGQTVYTRGNAGKKAKMQKEADKLFTEADNYIKKQIEFESKATQALEEANIENAEKLTEGTKAWWEAKKKNAQARLDALKDTQKDTEEWKNLADEIRQADKMIKNFDITGSDKKDANAEKKAEAERKKAEAAAEKLKKWGVDIQNDIDASVVAAMEEGREKRLAELKADYDKRIALIEQKKHEIELLENEHGVDGTSQKSMLDALAENEKKKYEAQTRIVGEASSKVLDSVWNEINARFRTESENRLNEIDRFYAEQAKKAKENGATQMELDDISLSHKRDIELETHQIALETLDFETEIELKRAEIADKRVFLQTDREEKILKIQLNAAKKRLQKLQEIEAAGGDTAKDIELAKVEIDKLSAAIKKIPVERIKEVGGHLKNWLGNLSGVGGELGDIFSALADGVDGVTAAFDKNATTADHIGNGIAGLVKLYQMAAAQIEENKRKQQEWNDKIEESAHQARLLRIEESKYQQSNVFGVENPYAKAISGANQYRQAMTELNDSLNKLAGGQVQVGTKKVVSGKNIATGAGAGAAVGAAVGSIVPVIGTALGAVIGGVLGGIFGATQKKLVPVFESLTQKFGSILKKGTETFELNPAILENYSKLDDTTKKLVDNWEEIRKKALEAQEQMRQTFSDLAGDIGDSLSNALVNSFRNNDLYSAVDEFEKKLTGTIENIIAQLVFSAHFQSMFDELQQRMEDSFGIGGDGDIVDDIVWFSKVYKDQIAAYGKSMEEVREEMARQGFDIFAAESGRTAVNKGIAQASQDSIDELNGRITFLVMKVSDLGTINASILDQEREQLVVAYAMLGHMEVIAENSIFLQRLQDIDENIGKLVREGTFLKR